VLERGGNELPVQDLLHPESIPISPGGPVSSISRLRDPEQPRLDRPVIGAQLGQVTPGPEEGFLHDVIRARPVRAELLDVTVQGLGVERVQLADRGIGIAGQLADGRLCVSSHIY
jgi:hypothetical protein